MMKFIKGELELKTFVKGLLAIGLAVGLIGCGAEEQVKNDSQEVNQEQQQEVITITLMDETNGNGSELFTKEVEITEGESLLDVMNREFEIVDQGDGFITAIEGLEVNEEKNFWLVFEVNGEPSMVGAADAEVKVGDKIVWILRDFN